jgi:hypothetical protein
MTRSLHEALSEIRKDQKCRNCICLWETLKPASRNDDISSYYKEEFSEWVEETNAGDIHDCLGCDPCLPVKEYNVFRIVSSDSER